MSLKPLLSYNVSIALFILGAFGTGFLGLCGVAHLVGMEQFVSELDHEEQSDAVRACFVSSAIYAALAVVSGSQIFLNSKYTSNSRPERQLSVELSTLEANQEINPKPSTPLALKSPSSSLYNRRVL